LPNFTPVKHTKSVKQFLHQAVLNQSSISVMSLRCNTCLSEITSCSKRRRELRSCISQLQCTWLITARFARNLTCPNLKLRQQKVLCKQSWQSELVRVAHSSTKLIAQKSALALKATKPSAEHKQGPSSAKSVG